MAERWSSLPWRCRSCRPGGSGESEEGAFVWLPLSQLPPGGRELWSGRKIPLPFPFPNSDCAVPAAEMRTARTGVLSAAGRGEGGNESQLPFLVRLLLCAGDYRAPRLCAGFPLGRASAPSGLIPLPPPAFIRPAPGPVLAVCRPLLFEFRRRTEGAFVDVSRSSSPRRPLLAGRDVRVGGPEGVPLCLCLPGTPLHCSTLLSSV